jgi:E3 ubiquitin-protein ligase TRIP12
MRKQQGKLANSKNKQKKATRDKRERGGDANLTTNTGHAATAETTATTASAASTKRRKTNSSSNALTEKGKGKQRKHLRVSRYTSSPAKKHKKTQKMFNNKKEENPAEEPMDTEQPEEDQQQQQDHFEDEDDFDLDLDEEEEEEVRRAVFGRLGGGSTSSAGGSGGGNVSQRFADSALQGLLKKLGAGLEDLLPTGGSGGSGGGSGSGGGVHHSIFGGHSALFGSSSSMAQRLKPILLGLKRYDDEQSQIAALTELCDVLTVSSEETLVACFSCEAFMPPLVELLRCEHNPDVALFAGRALTTLADLMPPRTAVSSMLRLGAADAFCAKLMCVEYIDVAEQSLLAMEKISSAGKEHATVCMRAGGVQAVLSFLDFFQTGVQRVAVKTAANMLSCVSSRQDVTMIRDALPILVNLLSYGDDKIVENAFLGLARALSGMSGCMGSLKKPHGTNDDYVSTILSTKMLDEMTRLLQVSESGSMHSSLSSSSYYEAVRTLSKCCDQSALVAEKLLDLGVPAICNRLLESFSMASASSAATTPAATPGTTPTAVAALSPMASPSMRSSENTLAIMKLMDAILPPIPENASNLQLDSKQLEFGAPESHPITDMDEGGQSDGVTFSAILERKPDIVEEKASKVILPTLFGMVGSTLAYQLKQASVSCMKKLLVYTSSEGLKDMLRELPASGTLMGLLSSKDSNVQLDAIFMAEVLLDKLPTIFVRYFMKEGVVFSIDQIAQGPTTSSSPGDEAKRGTTSSRRRSRSRSDPKDEDFVTPKDKLKTRVVQRAKECQEKYVSIGREYGIDSQALPAEMEVLQKLAQGIAEGDASALSSFLDRVLSEGGISSFELVHAGLEKALLTYFSASSADSCYKQTQDFAEVFSKRKDAEDVFKALLQRLHEIVSSRENMPVLTCPARPPSSSSMRFLFFERSPNTSKEANGLAALAHPFKLRFSRKVGEKELRDYSSNVVLVEPLSTFEVIEDFLRTRVAPLHSSSASGSRAKAKDSGKRDSSKQAAASTSNILTRSRSKQKQEEEGGSPKATANNPAEASTSTRRVTRSAASKRANEALGMDDDGGEEDLEEEEEQHMEEDPMGSSDISDIEEDEDDLEDDHDDVLNDEMDEDEDEGYENSFRFRRESEVHEVDVNEKNETKSHKAAEPRSANYAEKAAKKKFNLQFFLNGKPVDSQASVFQAVLNENNAFTNADDPQDSSGGPSVWDKVHTFTYNMLTCDKDKATTRDEEEGQANNSRAQTESKVVDVKELVKEKLSGQQFIAEEIDQEIASVLDLINILIWLKEEHSRAYHFENDFVFLNSVQQDNLVSSRLTSKVMRQLQDLLIICGKCLPAWVHSVVRHYPFLFPFDLRRQYFHLTSLGVGHAIQYLLQQIPNGDSLRQELRDVRLVRNRRQKVRIARDKLLDSACKVMDLYGKSQASLEIEYFGEVGTGLGPTLEFYTLLSAEMQRRDLNMWLTAPPTRREDLSSTLVEDVPLENAPMESDQLIFGEMDSVREENKNNPQGGEEGGSNASKPSSAPTSGADVHVQPLGDGLFPIPQKKFTPEDKNSNVPAYFKLLGTTVAKALYDGRLLDISLSTAFWRVALGEKLSIYDLACVDSEMSKSLLRLHKVACSSDPTKMDGMPVEDLGLYFILPGNDAYELCPNGSQTLVTGQNLSQFIESVLDAYFGSGTAKQFSAFRDGFGDVFSLSTLEIFRKDELFSLTCGQTEKWTAEMLTENLKFDHGYSKSSVPIKYFISILEEFSEEEKRKFLCFATGSPRLPAGGLKGLNPPLTIVRKNFTGSSGTPSAGNTPSSLGQDHLQVAPADLPSVMTCVNYIKLPPYTSLQEMKARLKFAIDEGSGSFNLS